MWLSHKMLSELVDLDGITPEQIAARITMASAEIEGVEKSFDHLNTIIAAKILKVAKHPNADKLTLVDLDTGNGTTRVVCGAPNHKEGDIVPLALPGTKFSEEFVIQKSKIRGEESNGMLCSSRELKFSDEHAGILILPTDTKLGITLSELFADKCDIKYEIDNKSVTHRPDLWGHVGFARELGALFGRKINDPVKRDLAKSFKNEGKLNVKIESPDDAPRYCGLVVKNIKIAESPDWLKARLESIGMRPISIIVDITNYVMAELGEPIHPAGFFVAKLRGRSVDESVVLVGTMVGEILIAGVPLGVKGGHRVNSPVEKDSEFGVGNPAGYWVLGQRFPVRFVRGTGAQKAGAGQRCGGGGCGLKKGATSAWSFHRHVFCMRWGSKSIFDFEVHDLLQSTASLGQEPAG